MVVNEETVSLQAQQVTCFLLITDKYCVDDKCCESQTITLYLIIPNWTTTVNCGVWWKEDEIKGALIIVNGLNPWVSVVRILCLVWVTRSPATVRFRLWLPHPDESIIGWNFVLITAAFLSFDNLVRLKYTVGGR